MRRHPVPAKLNSLDADMTAILEDFGNRVRKEDPVVHFYETFLAAYDPKMREMRGVYYTPEPVVSYIVRSVDHLLKTKFDKPQGLADPNVLILDPACGTGTFLFYVVKLIYERMVEQGQQGGWNDYVEKHLLPRLFGFELLMAPYSIAHLKLGLILEETGYQFKSDQRLGIYLTNSLEEAVKKSQILPFAGFINEEANAAAEIKRDKPIMVVLGNPPYSGHSANKGPWIDGLLKGKLPDGTQVPSYYEVDGKPLGEKNPKWLQDDYVKFIRFGQWRIEQTGYGILAYISNNGYLDNPTFRGMRQQLRRAFSEINILDLHGNTKKREVAPDGSKDENVFDIQQGVGIALFVKEKEKQGEAEVRHADLWGLRERDKYPVLSEEDITSTPWTLLSPDSPFYLFVPQDVDLRAEYEIGWKVTETMPVNSVGIVTACDHLTIQWSPSQMLETVKDFASLSIDAAREKYHLGEDAQDWSVPLAQADVFENDIDEKLIAPILYRPFDIRFTYYTGRSRGFLCRPRPEVMRHMLGHANLGMAIGRAGQVIGADEWDILLCSRNVTEFNLYRRGGNNYFPLYLYPDPKSNGDLFTNGCARHVNLAPAFIADMEKRLGMTFVPDGRGNLGRPDTPVGRKQGWVHNSGSRDRSVPPTGHINSRKTEGVPPAGDDKTNGIGKDLTRRRHHLPHWQQGGSVYFITFRSARGELPKEALRPVVEAIRYDHGRRYLYLAVVMPDHTHLLLQPREKRPGIWYDLADILKAIKGVSARRINQLLGTEGTVWQEESFDRIVRDDAEFLEKWNYMLNNPLKNGLVSDYEDYEFLVSPETLASGGPDTPVGRKQGWIHDPGSRDRSVPPTKSDCVPPTEVDDVSSTGTFGPEDVFSYIYAVFHSPTYRTRYAEFLKIDFPRVPLTSDADLFRRLVEKGDELVSLHLMESPTLGNLITTYPVTGSNEVEKVRYDETSRRVFINKEQYFEGIDAEVWEFHVGGYQVLEKWLKDRKGRKLTCEDQQHYQKIVVALKETMRLMGETDGEISAWPIS